jgi:hypothetical protein
MAHKADEKQFPVSMRPSAIRELQKVAIDLQEHVPRSRAMNRGPMVGYVMRWFLSLPREVQIKIVRTGKDLREQDVTDDAIAIVNAMGLDEIIASLVERPATGTFWGGDAAPKERAEHPREDVDERLEGKKGPVGVRRKAPRGK